MIVLLEMLLEKKKNILMTILGTVGHKSYAWGVFYNGGKLKG